MLHHLANTLQRGLSLIELLVTMSIAVILLTIGVPSFIDMMASNTATSYANDLLADINYARSEAITRGMRVVVCKGATATDCSTGNWESGWKVFVDCNASNTVTNAVCPDGPDAGTANDDEEVLRVHPALSNGWTLRGAFFGNTAPASFVSFRADGSTNNNGTLVTCKGGVLNVGNQTRSSAVVVLGTGRARVSPDGNNDGIPDGVASCNL